MPCSLAVRGINDGPRASSAATGSRGADEDATSGFNSLASRRAWADQAITRSSAFSRCMASVSLPRGATLRALAFPCPCAGLLLKW
jgi:hypothetical protein